MHTLVLNLTRFGDLLQTQPVISGLARRGDSVGLLCLENFASATGLLRDLSYVKSLPSSRLLASLDRDWKEAAAAAWSWSEDVLLPVTSESGQTHSPDTRVLNLTTALSVRLLTRLLSLQLAAKAEASTECLGFGLDPDGYAVNSNLWATFLQASSKNRGCSPFNLVDLFWNTAGLGEGERRNELRTPDAQACAKADELLADAGPDKSFVAFQLGASENRRRWPVAHFVSLGKRLHEETGCVPVLLGSMDEAQLANRYLDLGGPGISLVGRTSLEMLAAVLQRMRLLVSNDTGTMHLAAGLGRPIVAIFLATAQPWDTGPYKSGNICLEPDLPCHPCQFGRICPRNEICRQTIDPAVVFCLCLEQLDSETASTPDSYNDCGSRVWLSQREDNGFMGLLSLSGHDLTDRVRWIRLQRHFYRHFLDLQTVPVLTDAVSELSPEAHQSITDTLRNVLALLGLLEEQSKVLERMPRDALKKKFLSTWQRVQALWESNPYFNVLSYLWMNESQDSGQNLSAIRSVIVRYQQLTQSWLTLLQ